jgi:NAD(P)H-nitrite reductase large subunit
MVDRCVCHQVPLTRVKRRADELRAAGITGETALLETLADELRCTTGCGMCRPYVKLTLRTGRTAFDHRDPAVRAVTAEG